MTHPKLGFMGSNDTLKTRKRTIQKHEQAHDGHHDKTVKAAKRKERQKGKSIIKEWTMEEQSEILRKFIKKYGKSQEKKE